VTGARRGRGVAAPRAALSIVHGHIRFVPLLAGRIGLFHYVPRAIFLGVIGGLAIQVARGSL
jgi:hypothetical protein